MENLFTRFDISKLRHATHVEYHGDVNALLSRVGPGSLGVKNLADDHAARLAEEIAAFDVIRKSDLTAKIEELDRQRNDTYRGLVSAVESNLHHFEPAKRDAATALKIILDHYGNITTRPYDDQAALTTDLVAELSLPDHAARVTTLLLAPWVTELSRVNTEFIETMRERYTELSKRPAGNMKDARVAVDKLFHAILARIDAVVLLNGIDFSEELSPFIAELNEISTRYKNILAAHLARHPAGSPEPPAPPATE
jgi:hypothetical protein